MNPKRREVRSYWFQGSDFILRAGCMAPCSSDSCTFWLVRASWEVTYDWVQFIVNSYSGEEVVPTPSSESHCSTYLIPPWWPVMSSIMVFSGTASEGGNGSSRSVSFTDGSIWHQWRRSNPCFVWCFRVILSTFSCLISIWGQSEVTHQYGIRYHQYVDHTQLCISPLAGKQLLLILSVSVDSITDVEKQCHIQS